MREYNNFQLKVVADVIEWIESNIEGKIFIDKIVTISGYSLTHIQRIFKLYTGYKLAEYIRLRKLSCAAIELKTGLLSVNTISQKYAFDSQQTFHHRFKDQFKVTPVSYRLMEGFATGELTLKYEIEANHPPAHIEIVTKEPFKFLGKQITIPISAQEISTDKSKVSKDTLYETLGVNKKNAEVFVSVNYEKTFSSKVGQEYNVNVIYTSFDEVPQEDFSIDGGLFIKIEGYFDYESFYRSVEDVYFNQFKNINAIRREGAEFEYIKFEDGNLFYIKHYIPIAIV